MVLLGTATAEQEVIVTRPGSVSVELEDAGEIRRLGRLLLAGREANLGTMTNTFADDLIAALGFDVENTAKR